ncbi:MAG TPA: sulfur carrier protein ThiS [Desulfomonilaceae bacterium]|nr:sulfur carrier protein ThiS [Desulfomonilaceae bacterium]
MTIVVNGNNLTCADGLTIQRLLTELALSSAGTVVQRNDSIVQRTEYPTTVLVEGDSLELIQVVGGG